MSVKVMVNALGVVAASAGAPGLRLMDFPMTGECTEATANMTKVTSSFVSQTSCSPWNLATCAGVVTTATVTCGGPEDLPCIAAILAATGSCGACICALINYDCFTASSEALAEFGSCEDAGYTKLQETRDLDFEEVGVDVVVDVFGKGDEERHLQHLMDMPEEGLCSQMRSRDVPRLPSNTTLAPGGCHESGFAEFNTYGSVVADAHVGVAGCSAANLATCAGVVTTATVTCGGPEDLPCIAAVLVATGACGSCVCSLIHYDCALAIPVEVFAKHDNILQV